MLCRSTAWLASDRGQPGCGIRRRETVVAGTFCGSRDSDCSCSRRGRCHIRVEGGGGAREEMWHGFGRRYTGQSVLRAKQHCAASSTWPRRCELFLTNDSGGMHIASAAGVPTAVVFGPTDEMATGPAGSGNAIIRHPVECSPCHLRECPIDHRCMTRVSAEFMAESALELLK